MHCSVTIAFLLGGEENVSMVLGSNVGLGSQSRHGASSFELAFVGAEAHSEAKLMIIEKIDAAMEASYNLLRNGDISAVVARYREHVSANADRLSLR
jgi:hypothetical protein